ncbi:MAG: hypothetical protein CMB75_02280 [Euryarchaeota archaeon]|nr:hypothetical protein [Euryarchaeota archaeon]
MPWRQPVVTPSVLQDSPCATVSKDETNPSHAQVHLGQPRISGVDVADTISIIQQIILMLTIFMIF